MTSDPHVDGLIHSVHGLLVIRAEQPPAGFDARLARMFGPSAPEDPDREPDIVIRFGQSLPRRETLRYIDLNRAAYDEDDFYLLDADGRRMRVELARIGDPGLELQCEAGMTDAPLLFQLASIRLRQLGHAVLHASAFAHQGRGVLATGWRKGGKTELLLAFAAHGAEFVSDEWTIAAADGTLRGIPRVAGIWGWHVRELPAYRAALTPAERFRLRAVAGARAVARASGGRGLRGPLRDLATEVGLPLLSQVRPTPERLFGGRVRRDPVPLDVVLLPTVGDSIAAAPVDPVEVAQRAAVSAAHERAPLADVYDYYRFAFPARRAPALEAADDERRLFEDRLRGRAAYEVTHPYPVSLAALYDVVAGCL